MVLIPKGKEGKFIENVVEKLQEYITDELDIDEINSLAYDIKDIVENL